MPSKKSIEKWQFGDFQTPDSLARKVVEVIKRNHAIDPELVIEPTCGRGAFLIAAYQEFKAARVLGFEINPSYVADATAALQAIDATERACVQEADFFNTDWSQVLKEIEGSLLIIGNPPWVTSSELGMLNSNNLPEKSNFQNRKGIDAITGSGNFDISEWMLLQHINWLANRDGLIAFLCKYSVARKVMRQVSQSPGKRYFGHIYPIDAKAYFGASVEACLFVLSTNSGNADCEIYSSLDSTSPSHVIGERDGFIVNDVLHYEKWRHLKGQDPHYIWRSGVKHDCSKVMELQPASNGYVNGSGEIVVLEDNYVFPLLKSSDVGNGKFSSYRKVVLVTQQYVGEDTSQIKTTAPSTWQYLSDNKKLLRERRSSIYKGKPDFSIFGVGSYTFKPWKVAISGLYKNLNFSLVGPLNGKPVIFDDTVNFLSFDSEEEALFVFQLITSKPSLEFLESLIFWDEKRPITTQILRRLSIKEVARELGELIRYQEFIADEQSSTAGQIALGILSKKAKYSAAGNS